MLLKDIFVKDKRQARSKQVAGDKDGKGVKVTGVTTTKLHLTLVFSHIPWPKIRKGLTSTLTTTWKQQQQLMLPPVVFLANIILAIKIRF